MLCLGEPDWSDLISDHPYNDGLVSLYLAGEHTWGNARWFDAVPFRNGAGGNHGTLVGPTWQGPLGRPGGYGSLNFASTTYVEVGTPASLKIAGALTLSAWVRMTAANAFGLACGYADAAGNSAGYGIYYDSSLIHFFSDLYSADATASFSADSIWHHIAGVYVPGQVDIYKDGLVGTPRVTAEEPTYGAGVFRISSPTSGFTWWGGQVDEVCVWNRALSASDVSAVFQDSRQDHPLTLNWLRSSRAVVAGGAAANRRRRVICVAAA